MSGTSTERYVTLFYPSSCLFFSFSFFFFFGFFGDFFFLGFRHAVVTGANKGIGFEIVRQLASNGVTVILTARDENRGLEAVEKLKEKGLSDNVLFHPLDVANPTSIARLADFIKTRFGKLDILVILKPDFSITFCAQYKNSSNTKTL